MSFCVIDAQRCIRCGACVTVCPLKIITIDTARRLPVSIAEREPLCIQCGHCVAVCPSGAFTLSSMPPGSCRELTPGWDLSFEAIENFLCGRRSIRVYKNDIVTKDSIEKIINAARYAPSGINRQPVRWAVIHDPARVQRVSGEVINWMRTLIAQGDPMAVALRMEAMVGAWESGNDCICRGAPHIVCVYALRDDMTAPAACTIAATYFELAAASLGLGACWAGYVQMAVNAYDPARRAAGIPRQAACFSSLMFGYPAYRYRRIPLRNPARILWR
ncbi:MAG: nitroreductase family protein [Candidatus Omnitrophica bacterium]|nr:nitroreductase family protein [Candidatus Omnitrophota bacterium]